MVMAHLRMLTHLSQPLASTCNAEWQMTIG